MKIVLCKKLIPYSRYIRFQEKSRKSRNESILFLEHSPTITSGTGSKIENLLTTQESLFQKGIDLLSISRGGDYTAHEPGQLVIYPHIDIKSRNLSIIDYLKIFKESISNSIYKVWRLETIDNPESPGLYLKANPTNKLVSIGITFKSFFTSFGASVNISNNLDTFQYIHPCGGKAENMTSIKKLELDTLLRNDFLMEFKKNFFHELNI
jgi:lipoyl(octanoyl) transferase